MELTSLDITTCPDCGSVAEVQWRATMDSTEGPIEHVKILCVRRHWFLLPVARLAVARPGTAMSGELSTRGGPE
jgi:hypothetical protein